MACLTEDTNANEGDKGEPDEHFRDVTEQEDPEQRHHHGQHAEAQDEVPCGLDVLKHALSHLTLGQRALEDRISTVSKVSEQIFNIGMRFTGYFRESVIKKILHHGIFSKYYYSFVCLIDFSMFMKYYLMMQKTL